MSIDVQEGAVPDSRIEEILRTDPISSIEIEPVQSIPPTMPLRDVIARMQKRRVAAVVIAENGRVTGIFTERDVLNRIIGLAMNENLPVGEVMTRKPTTIGAHRLASEAFRLMKERGFDQILVVDERGRAVGLLDVQDRPVDLFDTPEPPAGSS